jgi:light-regulated signal transduction histidine kinase (bacteriophytochrome)
MHPGPGGGTAEAVSAATELERDLAERSAELRQAHEEMRHLLYVISHDLREASRMTRSYMQLLSRRYSGKLDEDADTYIRYAVGGMERMDELLDDLLAYSRVVNLPLRPPAEVSLEMVLRFALDRLATSIRDAGAVVTHDPMPVAAGDEAQLTVLFSELIENAIKFHGSEPPCVHIASARTGDGWLFSVRDNGQGIEPQYFDSIFSVFRRLHGREYPGTGMGLAIARKIVERHGGRIWVESRPGCGSVFHFTLA